MEIIVYNSCPVRVLLSSILNHHKRDARKWILSDSYGALRYRINSILAIALITVKESQDNGFLAIANSIGIAFLKDVKQ
ncbi:hypothetical protein [Dolichospermum circinale]|uniref:hypothetical protein n=1 Tax=Dolichospermum circinale TaxID=109265 RepID=UPI00232CCB1B|nr:hypothetical protein [Dolichospermum circinale]MDB9451022.1 hypothetical protein [Dolichospermum circinale CS-547]